jgi:small GTP-binding protein
MNEDYEEVRFKVSFIGDYNVGKTSLIFRGTDDVFPASQPTIGVDFLVKTFLMNGIKAKVMFWDTVGAERFKSPTYTNHLFRSNCFYTKKLMQFACVFLSRIDDPLKI